jgi:hypothetical protein
MHTLHSNPSNLCGSMQCIARKAGVPNISMRQEVEELVSIPRVAVNPIPSSVTKN